MGIIRLSFFQLQIKDGDICCVVALSLVHCTAESVHMAERTVPLTTLPLACISDRAAVMNILSICGARVSMNTQLNLAIEGKTETSPLT